jgi:hypothetical protein
MVLPPHEYLPSAHVSASTFVTLAHAIMDEQNAGDDKILDFMRMVIAGRCFDEDGQQHRIFVDQHASIPPNIITTQCSGFYILGMTTTVPFNKDWLLAPFRLSTTEHAMKVKVQIKGVSKAVATFYNGF